MAVFLKKIIDVYDYLEEVGDPRTTDLYIMRNPFIIFGLLFAYHRFVYDWGPKFMEKRKPFQLENTLIVYNAIQIVIAAYICFKSIILVWWSGYYSISCQPLNFEDTPLEREILFLVWLYYFTKIMDLLDTVFFVLRKKYNQVTFLHVYHHIGMVFTGFMALKYIPAGHGTMLGTVNCFVHMVMYFYYLLSAYSPAYKQSLWWKKYITQMQILQFMYLFIHFGQVLFMPNCGYPKWVSFIFVPQNIFMTIMFCDFYYKAYIKKKTK